MNKQDNGWTLTFWIVTVLCIIQYLFITLPRISQTANVGVGFYLGSLLPNAIIILIFWRLKKKRIKKYLINKEYCCEIFFPI